MSEIAIREARESDLSDILRAYDEAGIGGGVSFTAEEARQQFAKLQQYPSYRVFVAETNGTIAGTYSLVILDKLAKCGARAAVVEDVAVLPAFQGRGIGRAMMAHAREECRSAGCYKMTLSSHLAREGAHRFYDSLGFERHGYSFLMQI
jgi:GNAT superfamily N-acetyltransferase